MSEKRIYNKFSEKYDKIYHENIIQFQKKLIEQNFSDQYFVDFYPCFGNRPNEKVEFIIYGQATNGWRTEFKLSDSIDSKYVKISAAFSNDYLAEYNHNPLDWVNAQWTHSIFNENCKDDLFRNFYSGSYRAYRSFFWNVMYKLICDYYKLDRKSWDWSKKLVWSNLYKIAPEDANPKGFVRSVQNPISIELVRKEIEEINPKFCIVLTNDEWWSPFREGLKTEVIQRENLPSEIVGFEKYNETKIIITNRPWNGNKSELFVQQILELIGS